jgi:hypothetical protein
MVFTYKQKGGNMDFHYMEFVNSDDKVEYLSKLDLEKVLTTDDIIEHLEELEIDIDRSRIELFENITVIDLILVLQGTDFSMYNVEDSFLSRIAIAEIKALKNKNQ